MSTVVSYDEADHDARRARQWLAGQARDPGVSRAELIALGTAMSALAAADDGREPVALAAEPVGVDPGIVKPLDPALLTPLDGNAELRWEAMAGQGYVVPNDRFFVRNHTHTPRIDAGTWRLRLYGDGLRDAPTRDAPVELDYATLRALPAVELPALVECAGNGRHFFASQQDTPVSGVQWRLGGVGVARWRGVPLATVLRHAGLTADAVDVMPEGLDPPYVTGGVDLGRVRRPLPIGKALDDVLLAYEMNGVPLPADHGFPVRVVVPGWIGISSVKWVGAIEVSTTPLFSPWNTGLYRMFGPGQPADGGPADTQSVKSAFELPWDARLPAGVETTLTGRSWSGAGPIDRVEVDTGDGWRPATLVGADRGGPWQRWSTRWCPPAAGRWTLRARAVDVTGRGQPDRAGVNDLGYLFDGVVRHPVTAL
ncbi:MULTISPECIES: sulfite oxidase [unclassified Micromonospora]|uniref:sulfite oxidase n=1 Tax=unclassified Micromonospora TaxID=2617518 RepID=UPI00197BC346|nr:MULTISPECIES: sulfite oxidase [unclassified Micromonospora]